jgi:hypothetical protein
VHFKSCLTRYIRLGIYLQCFAKQMVSESSKLGIFYFVSNIWLNWLWLDEGYFLHMRVQICSGKCLYLLSNQTGLLPVEGISGASMPHNLVFKFDPRIRKLKTNSSMNRN